MNGMKTLAEGAAQSYPLEWHEDRLSEARSIVADVAHHPDTLVLLAYRVICAHTLDPLERAEALGLLQVVGASKPTASTRVGGAS